jgi:3' terminal RNA ribose 2'-O-methyltransferase Hen1
MIVTISYAGPDATDLGYLLHKHPAKAQTFDMSVGKAHVFYPEATEQRCTAALLLEVDPIGMVRQRRYSGGSEASLDHYVNDRPYASSSMLAVAIGQVFRTAMTGRCDSRPHLAAAAIPLEISLAAVPSKGAAGLAASLFEPMGWRVTETRIPLDSEFPDWGDSNYANLTITGTLRLSEALRQIYVLLPVLDDAKHYWVSDDEVAKLLRAGHGWLPSHPQRDLITRRYLAHQRSMVDDATARLQENDEQALSAAPERRRGGSPLGALRADAVVAVLKEINAHRVGDLGCGEGSLMTRLAANKAFTEIFGTDVSPRALVAAEEKLHLRELGDMQRERIHLLQSSVTYQDDRIRALDAVVMMEVIEHIDPGRLPGVEANVFGHARAAAVVVTTPNADYNPRYPGLAPGALRHPDHRFEWGRQDFAEWAQRVGAMWGYDVEIRTVGDIDPSLGAPTQLALFRRSAA